MSRRGWLLFAAMCLLWGLPYLMIKVAVTEVSPPVVVLARTGIGAAVLLPLAIRSGSLVMLKRRWQWVLAFAALEIIGPWWLLSDAEQQLSSSMTGLLIATVPIISVVMARFFGDTERLTKKRLIGLLVGLGGVAVLAIPNLTGGAATSVAELLLLGLGYSAAPMIAAYRLADVPSVVLTTGCLTVAALFYIGPAAATWPATMPSASALYALTGLGVLCTALALVVFFALIRMVGAPRALVCVYVNPAVAVVAGVALLDEPLTPAMIIAFAMVLVGSALATGRGPVPVDEDLDSGNDVADQSFSYGSYGPD
ncbi:MAG: DMT family transporter [Mycobacterium sp.]|nr:DMT family transporter [Mycobacterium sp.]